MDTVMCAVFLLTCFLGTSLQAEHSEELGGDLCTGGPGLWPVPADCGSFILCVGGATSSNATAARLLHCPPHMAFSGELRTCVPAAQVVSCEEQAGEERSDPILIHVPSRQRRAGKEVAQSEKGCGTGVLGPICADCNQLVICAQLNGHFTPIASVSCSSVAEGQTCSENQCMSGGPTCKVAPKPLSFRCLEPGIFPDPEDCSRYHLCGADMGHISDTCDERYDPESRSCMESPEEPATLPPCGASMGCSKMAAVLAVAHAPAYYALCLPSIVSAKEGATSEVTYQMTVLRCPEGQLFDEKLKMCRDSCGSRRGRLPVDSDCRAYIECSGERAQPRRLTCSQGLAFHAGRRMCLPESQVPACVPQESITSPPRVTPQDATVSSQTKRVASRPIQATPAVINIPLLQPPVCITEGRFIYHSDCRRYIQCRWAQNGALTIDLRWCPLFTYFDPAASACRIGFC